MIAGPSQFEVLYICHRKRLENYIRRKIGCSATAGDLVQDIFLRFWEIGEDRTDDASAYLTRSARNAAIDHVRSKTRKQNLLTGILPEQYAAAPTTPLEAAIARDGLRSIDAAIAALPKQTRHIFLLNRVHGRTFVEIAGAMGISERAVAKHMARAMAACQAAFS